MTFTVMANGHRPPRLHPASPYGEHARGRLYWFALHHMRQLGVGAAISGMALGWDMAWAQAAVDEGLPLIAAITPNQCATWPDASQRIYGDLLARASEVHMIGTGGWAAHDLSARSLWMVWRADMMAALWDGSPSGTSKTIGHANLREGGALPVVNLWDAWVAYRGQCDAMLGG